MRKHGSGWLDSVLDAAMTTLSPGQSGMAQPAQAAQGDGFPQLRDFQAAGPGVETMSPEAVQQHLEELEQRQAAAQQHLDRVLKEKEDVASHLEVGKPHEGMGTGTLAAGSVLGAGAGAGAALKGRQMLEKRKNPFPNWMGKGASMSLIDELRNEAVGVAPRSAEVAGYNLDSIITKVAFGEGGGEGGGAEDGQNAGGFGGVEGEGGSEGMVDGSGEVPNADTPELPPELQQLLMVLMQHPELMQQIMHGGQPGGAAAGMGGPPGAEHDQMAQALMAGGGGGGPGGAPGGAPGAEAGGAPPMGM